VSSQPIIDMTTMDPWSAYTPDLLTRSLTHITRAYLEVPGDEPLFLDLLEEGTISWDETRSPRVQASLTCKIPQDQALLDRLDPRTGVRLFIEAGYLQPSRVEDVQPLADLVLRTRTVTRPDDTMILEATSDESILIDVGPSNNGSVTASTTTAAMTTIIGQAFHPDPTITITSPVGPAVSAMKFEDRWDVLVDLADQISARVYDNGLRKWFIEPMPVITVPALYLSVGENGTIISSDTGLTRDEGFANYVWLQYKWDTVTGEDTVSHVINSTRKITSGPYSVTESGSKILKFEREVGTTQAKADKAAEALVKRTVTRGRSFSLDAISAYWLRPGHTIQVQLPLGGPENHLVTAVDFDLRDGTMHVTTRLPDGDYTIGA